MDGTPPQTQLEELTALPNTIPGIKGINSQGRGGEGENWKEERRGAYCTLQTPDLDLKGSLLRREEGRKNMGGGKDREEREREGKIRPPLQIDLGAACAT